MLVSGAVADQGNFQRPVVSVHHREPAEVLFLQQRKDIRIVPERSLRVA
jgi:hypothetical protein